MLRTIQTLKYSPSRQSAHFCLNVQQVVGLYILCLTEENSSDLDIYVPSRIQVSVTDPDALHWSLLLGVHFIMTLMSNAVTALTR
jgi:hypothetical protein